MTEFERDDDGDDAPADRDMDRTGIVDLSINVGLQSISDLIGEALGGGTGRRREQGDHVRSGVGVRPSEKRRSGDGSVGSTSTDYKVDSQRTDDQFIVTADLPGVNESDVDVGVDLRTNELVIEVEGQTIDRVSLPWPAADAAKVWFNNGILEVRVVPSSSAEDLD